MANLTKIGIIFIHSQQTAAVVLAIVIFVFDKVRAKRSVLLTKQSGISCFKNLVAHQSQITAGSNTTTVGQLLSTRIWTTSKKVQFRRVRAPSVLLIPSL